MPARSRRGETDAGPMAPATHCRPAGGGSSRMKVILRRDVKGVGQEGDMKEVRDGYARNFLLPTGAAVIADRGAIANWERHRDQRAERDRHVRPDAEATAGALPHLRTA